MATNMIKELPRASRKLVKRIIKRGYSLVATLSKTKSDDGRASAWLVNEENICMKITTLGEQFEDVLLLEAPCDIALQFGDTLYSQYDDATLDYIIKKYVDAVKEVSYEKK